MSDRSKTIWNLILGISLFSIIASGFKLFPLNRIYERIYDRSKNLQFGTDEELENVISFLEKRLEVRNNYRFNIKKEPMLLTNVLSVDGSGRRSRRNKSAIRIALVYQRQKNFQAQIDYRGKVFGITAGDEIENIGSVLLIDQDQVIIKNKNRVISYPAPGVGDGLPKELNNFSLIDSIGGEIKLETLGLNELEEVSDSSIIIQSSKYVISNIDKKKANTNNSLKAIKVPVNVLGSTKPSKGKKILVNHNATNQNSLVEKMFNIAIEKKNDESPNKNNPVPDILKSSIEPITKVKTVKKPPVDYDIPVWPSPLNLNEQLSKMPLRSSSFSNKSKQEGLIRQVEPNIKLNTRKESITGERIAFPTWKHELQTLLGLPKPAVNGNPGLMSFNELKVLLQTQKRIDNSIFMLPYKEVGFDGFQKFLDQNSEQIISIVRNTKSRSL